MKTEQLCSIGREVIAIEAQMINALAQRIDQNFVKACLLLGDCRGRIVVIGVGKSGHIGKKIAATFASTGSPAFFVHPNEAKHGDIGMLTPHDVVLAISNSGESEEILAIMGAIKRLNVPIITLTGRPQSSLAQVATVNLDVSVAKEACPLGLAPTASTTAALVMGDALAMALLEHRGFTKADFARSHPGGTLGRRLLLQVSEIMHQEEHVPKVNIDTLLKDALIEMTQKKLGMTTITHHDGRLAGAFTDGDVRRAMDRETALNTPIANLMSKNPKTIAADMLAIEALQLMESHKITSLIITNPTEQPIGILHIHDILRAGVV